MKKIALLLVLLCPLLVAAQPYESRYFHYDTYFDAPQPFKILATTIDGVDTEAIEICAGGACSAARGAYVELFGNENASHGRVTIEAGNDAGNGDIIFKTGALQHLQIPLSITTSTALAYGLAADSSPLFIIRSNKLDTADDGTLQLASGGAYGGTRGADIQLLGNDYGGPGAGGTLTINAGGGTAGYIDFWTESAANTITSKWTIPIGASATSDLVAGVSGTANNIATIKLPYLDGFDTGTLQLASGGAADPTRGAYISLIGNEVGTNPAFVNISTGISSVASINFSMYGNAGTGAYFQDSWGQLFKIGRVTGAVDDAYVDLIFGQSTRARTIATLRGTRIDNADDGILQLTAGGSDTLNGNRGAYIQLEGSDVGGTNKGGDINIIAGLGASTTAGEYPVITIRPDTADAADLGQVRICGGGSACNGTRGAELTLWGNESVGGGVAQLQAGGTAAINFQDGNGNTKWSIPYDAGGLNPFLNFGNTGAETAVATIHSNRNVDGVDDDTLQLTGGGGTATMAGGRGAYIVLQGEDVGGTDKGGNLSIIGGVGNAGTAGNHPVITVRNDTVDGSDWGAVKIAAGGAVDLATRGAFLMLDGNEDTQDGNGSVQLYSGDATGSVLSLAGSSDTSVIRFYVGGTNSTIRWQISGAADLVTDNLIFGRDTVANSVAYIRGARADASDDATLYLSAGGTTVGATRGAYIRLQGNEVGGGAGTGAGVVVEAGTGTTQTVVFKAAGTTTWTINTDGTLDANVTDAGWRAAAIDNQACTTTCGANKGCLFGLDKATACLVSCSDATADTCICTTT